MPRESPVVEDDFDLTLTTRASKMRRRRRGNPTIAVAYMRVSKDDQRLSPEAQRDAIEAWGRHQGVQIVAWFSDEGVCGELPPEERPSLLSAMHAVRQLRAGWLVVKKRDRLARDPTITAILDDRIGRCGARIVAADGVGNDDGPAGALMRQLVDGIAAYELELIRGRTRDALSVKRRRLERISRYPPFGWQLAGDPKRVEPAAQEQVVVQLVRELRSAKGMSYRQILHVLVCRGIRNRRGRPFHVCQIEMIISGRRDPLLAHTHNIHTGP